MAWPRAQSVCPQQTHKRKQHRMPRLTDPGQSNAHFRSLPHTQNGPAPPAFLFSCVLVALPLWSHTPLYTSRNSTPAVIPQANCHHSAQSLGYLYALLLAPHKMPSFIFPCWKSICLSMASSMVIFSMKFFQISPASKHIFSLCRICCTNNTAYSYLFCINITNLCALNYQ